MANAGPVNWKKVADTMRAVGVEPTMAEAIAQRPDWKVRLRGAGRSLDALPETADELLRELVGCSLLDEVPQ
jgi:hypothetical protein